MLQTHVGFCIDESGSVQGIVKPLVKAYNKNVDAIRTAVLDEGQEATMTALLFGHRTLKHRQLYVGQQVQTVKPLRDGDIVPSGMTPLFDSVYRAIKKLEELDDGKDTTTFIISVVTDGFENSSCDPGIDEAIRLMEEKVKTDQWTFTFLVPNGHGRKFAREFGIPAGNIQEWDETTAIGTETAFVKTAAAYTGYFQARSAGIRSTKSFYSDLSTVTVREARKDLSEITKQVQFIRARTDTQIRDLIINDGREWIKGAAFYQLVKTEKRVHDYKLVALRVKTSGKVYCGEDAREMLGIGGAVGTVRLVPGDHAKFDVFIQSTSVNRKIPAGTEVMYWPKVGTQKK
jgi:hypothetical protein